MDPKKLLERLPRLENTRPFRYLGRRVVQGMVEAATANLLLGKRSAPGRYLVVRLVESDREREEWEQQFAESRAVILKEIQREAGARDIELRGTLELDLAVLTDAEAMRGEAERVLSSVLDEAEVAPAAERLREEREVVLPRRVRTLLLESEPPGAQAYVDHRPAGVTPCRVEDIPEGDVALTFSLPGHLLYEDTYRVQSGRPGQRLTYRAVLEREPEMGVLEVRTFPPGARVTVRGESRESPARWRLPAGPVEVRVEMEDFAPESFTVDLPATPESLPHRVPVRLRYAGQDRDEVLGTLVIYKPGAAPQRSQPPQNTISSFFREADPETALHDWMIPDPEPGPAPELLAEVPLRRGVILIGRDDPGGPLRPDVRLFDPENSVSRGCHAWLWVYADTSTGATFNTFLIGNHSPAGILVDGNLVMETRRLSDDSVVEVGNFRMKVTKETPEARVEIAL